MSPSSPTDGPPNSSSSTPVAGCDTCRVGNSGRYPGDLVVANDAATLPASLHGTHSASGEPIEVRLAAWVSVGDPTQFVAIAFGAGDFRARTEDRPPPPSLSAGDRVSLGPLVAVVEWCLNHPRLFRLRFLGDRATILRGLARQGHPIQYAHVREPLALSDVWTRIAADPMRLVS